MARRFAAQAMGNVLERAYFLSREGDRKSTRLNSSHVESSYAVFCLKKKNRQTVTFLDVHTLHLELHLRDHRADHRQPALLVTPQLPPQQRHRGKAKSLLQDSAADVM